VLWAAMWDFMQDFQARGVAAWEDFERQRKAKPYPDPSVGVDEGAARQEALEKRYFGRS
jgi:hypothetical protein